MLLRRWRLPRAEHLSEALVAARLELSSSAIARLFNAPDSILLQVIKGEIIRVLRTGPVGHNHEKESRDNGSKTVVVVNPLMPACVDSVPSSSVVV